MRKSKEELNRIHKEKCKELKKVRARIAEDLGVELHQTECTYEGYCSGTCPKCKSEEWKLNAAIMKKQMEEADLKRRVATAGLTTVAALCLSGCNVFEPQIEGGISAPETIESLEGDVEYVPTEETEETKETVESLEGDVIYIPIEEVEGGMECAE